jgi:hypothetical protein
MSNGWFAPLDDEDRQLVISSLINETVRLIATNSGAPWLMLAAPPLQILSKRALQIWSGGQHRPTFAVAVNGREAPVDYRDLGGVELDATSLLQRRTTATQEISGELTTNRLNNQELRQGDPVALVVNNASWLSRRNGLLVPAKFGEPFRIRVPRGNYLLSAYSLDSTGAREVDPVTAIGVRSLSRWASLPTPIFLQPRDTAMTPCDVDRSSQTANVD